MRQAKWTEEKIKAGFERFISENDRLPRAHEVDEALYLPSSRHIQKHFGGLEHMRSTLDYTDVNFGKGINRSIIARAAGKAGRQLESDFETELVELFGRKEVHTEKVFYGKLRVDFYIYSNNQEFGVDVFRASTKRTFQSSINIKLKKYQYFTEPLYLAVASDNITQNDINEYISKRKSPLATNISIHTLTLLRKLLKYDM